ncbi:uncharacterized protein F4807DRAFT_434051 [Annulohypoxylon truncatum]|uniref:uncharacterized protein n=1 Tax=Annulohypoxylon truncatum TaxID=327061 RepID=UPI0020076715|nr:uncharacterized protein F4807DRAFT_434051 [Annulohypoxylon truncatum]KAI1207655.1 hypothetical protein F4807DRAFT_434051 [Annulohypoxylon truncatum]
MPTKLWRHGIHSFLELLRQRLPDSLDCMLTFIQLAYSMMALLYETVPASGDLRPCIQLPAMASSPPFFSLLPRLDLVMITRPGRVT